MIRIRITRDGRVRMTRSSRKVPEMIQAVWERERTLSGAYALRYELPDGHVRTVTV